jgi:hypothetical protein
LKKRHSVPKIELDQDVIVSNNQSIIISGQAKDENFISRISFKNSKLFTGGIYDCFISQARTNIFFNPAIRPDEGTYDVEITAHNLVNQTAVRHLTLHVDRSGPVISILSANRKLISGILYDSSDGISWCVNNGLIQKTDLKQTRFHAKPYEKGPFILKAWDRSGNETQADLTLILKKKSRQLISMITSGQSRIVTDTTPFVMKPKAKPPTVIKIENFPEGESVWFESIQVKGWAQSDYSIESITINNKIISNPAEGPYPVYFNESVTLHTGKNTILIRVNSKNKHQSLTKKIICIRESRQIDRVDYSYPLHLLKPVILNTTIHLQEEVQNNFRRLLYDYLTKSGRFNIFQDFTQSNALADVSGYVSIIKMAETQVEITMILRFSISIPSTQVKTFDAYCICESDRLNECYEIVTNRLVNYVLEIFERYKGRIVKINGNILKAEIDSCYGKPKFFLPLNLVRRKKMYSLRTGLDVGYDLIFIADYFPYSIDNKNNILRIKDSLSLGQTGDEVIGR